MKVLDIDLDFFLSHILRYPDNDTRPSADEFPPWAPECVHEFMERNCGLTSSSKLPAMLVRTHDEVFDLWKEQIRTGQLHAPFDVIHIDAHADLGLGDNSFTYILGELLHAAPHERQEPRRGGLNGLDETNYLAFAIACRWLRTLTYVHHPELPMTPTNNDLPRFLFRDWDIETRIIELGCYLAKDLARPFDLAVLPQPLTTEPPVPILVIPAKQFKDDGAFAFGYVSISPRYTPEEAEALVPVLGQFLQFLDREPLQ
jgi:hypothetical protein